ncbi:DUF3135 domain-containing protein [Ferrimonas marina]|uniref:DUF3135 domain-containing protein n=1 Tax=Ferrimonas marina TaxID=299255 RepID=A0A1M5QYF2_9GAMM|nr:DUF3135 domain-containing protein [Ferrimonas marina]SHH18739.1 Protein of unknown function [Ferrimonas marina]
MVRLPDFDTLAKLAKQDPQRLARLQRGWVRRSIAEARPENRARLRAMQSNLELRLSRCHNPYHRMITASALMQSQLQRLAEALNGPPAPPSPAKIIPWRRPAPDDPSE